MYFRLRYVLDGFRLALGEDEVLNFSFGGEHHAVVRILHVAAEAGDGKASTGKTLICEGVSEHTIEEAVQDGFRRYSEGTRLTDALRVFFGQVLSENFDFMRKTVDVLRWRRSIMEGPTNPFRDGTQAYSFDGTTWREEPRWATSLRFVWGHPFPQAKISEQLCEEIVDLAKRGAGEPFTRQLFREAWTLRESYPKAALTIGVAAAEIGFRQLVGRVAGRKGILTLLNRYWPHPRPIPKIHGRQIIPSATILAALKRGIRKRDAVVHEGAPAPDPDELRDILWNISQLLWVWDFYSGHTWALEHLAGDSISLPEKPSPRENHGVA